jgi:hypothetical protein
MQQVPQELIIPICVDAFGLPKNPTSQQIISSCLKLLPVLVSSDDYVLQLEYLTHIDNPSDSMPKNIPSKEILEQEMFQLWLMDYCEQPTKFFSFLSTQSIQFHPSVLNRAIQKQIECEAIEQILRTIPKFTFADFIEIMAVLELTSKDKKRKQWSRELQALLIAQVTEKLIPDPEDLNWEFCFHHQEKYFSVIKDSQLTLYFYSQKDSKCNSLLFNYDANYGLYDDQKVFSLFELAIYFEIPAKWINQFMTTTNVMNSIHQYSSSIHQRLKTKAEYFRALNTSLIHTSPAPLKKYLVTQDIYNYRFKALSDYFKHTGYFWNQIFSEQDDNIVQKEIYEKLWNKIVSAKKIIPSLQQELQSILNSNNSFEEWLFKHTPILGSLEILKKWQFEFPPIHSDAKNLLVLGICSKQPLKYFQFLIEKLHYKLSLEEYFNAHACLNCFVWDQTNKKWLIPLWEYLRNQGPNIVDMRIAHTIYSYHFNYEENSLMILSEFSSSPRVQHISIDHEKNLQIKTYHVKDLTSLKKFKFDYIFSSEFMIEQVNPNIISIYVLNILNLDIQIDFIKKLHFVLKDPKFLEQYPGYAEELNQTVIIKNENQHLEVKLDIYLEHHIKRLETTDQKWLQLVEQLNRTFQAKISIKSETKTNKEYSSADLDKLLSQENHVPQLSDEFIKWLMAQEKPISSLLKLISLGYVFECPSSTSFSLLTLAVLNYVDFEDFQIMLEQHQLKCSVKDYLFSLSFLQIHQTNPEKKQWAEMLKAYLLKHRFTLIIPNLSSCQVGFYFLNEQQSLIIHDSENHTYHLVRQVKDKLKLNHEVFYIAYSNQNKIIFDSPLQQAIKLTLPTDFLELMAGPEQIKEEPMLPCYHLYFTVLKLETSNPTYYQDMLKFIFLHFHLFDREENNLLHFLAKLDRSDLIHKHYPQLLQFIDQVNAHHQSPMTQALSCSSETFKLLIDMQPTITDSKLVYQYLVNPNYTPFMLSWLKHNTHHLDQIFPSGYQMIQEMFYQELHINSLVDIFFHVWPELFERVDPKELLLIHIHEKTTLPSFKTLLKQFKIDKNSLDIIYFVKACEYQKWELAFEVFRLECFISVIHELIHIPFIQECMVQQNIIGQYPELLAAIIPFIEQMQTSVFFKALFKQILGIAKSNPNWLSEWKEFPQLLKIGLELGFFHVNDQIKDGEPLIYFIEKYCYLYADYELIIDLSGNLQKLDINKKNKLLEHVLISILKQDNGIQRLQMFMKSCDDKKLQFNHLNAKGEHLLDIAIHHESLELIEWLFNYFELIMMDFAQDGLQKKQSTLLNLSQKNPLLFEKILQLIKPELIKACPHPYLKKYQIMIGVEEANDKPMSWEQLLCFLKDANAKQILNLRHQFKTEVLPKLIEEHNIVEIYQILRLKTADCMREFSKIKSLDGKLQDVFDYCQYHSDEDLLKQLQSSLPRDKVLKARISNWESLKKLLTLKPMLCIQLLTEQKLIELTAEHNPAELFIILIENGHLEYLRSLAEFKCIAQKLPTILNHCHQKVQCMKSVYPFLPNQLQPIKRLHLLSKTIGIAAHPEAKINSNALLALNLFNTKEPKYALELEKREKLLPKIWIERTELPHSLIKLYHLLKPLMHVNHQSLGLFGSSVRHLYNKKPHQSDYDCFAVFSCRLDEVFAYLKEHKFGNLCMIGAVKLRDPLKLSNQKNTITY